MMVRIELLRMKTAMVEQQKDSAEECWNHEQIEAEKVDVKMSTMLEHMNEWQMQMKVVVKNNVKNYKNGNHIVQKDYKMDAGNVGRMNRNMQQMQNELVQV